MSEDRREEARTRYVSGRESLRTLAEALDIPRKTLEKWSAAEGWREKRNKFRARVEKKASARMVNKRAKELAQLMEASGYLESALKKAAKAFDEDAEENAGHYPAGEMRARNLESLSKAVNLQADTRMRIAGILTREQEERLSLMRRKQEMDERKEKLEAEQNAGGARLILDPEAEELAK